MKQCPRCKSQLAKTRTDKVVCKVCGFVTKQLQVATNNEEFQQRHHFGKKITFRQSQGKNKNSGHQQSQQHYVFSFQNMLKDAANTLLKNEACRTNLQMRIRSTWLAYLRSAERNGVKIIGMFRKLDKKKQTEKQKQKQEQKEQESQQIPNIQPNLNPIYEQYQERKVNQDKEMQNKTVKGKNERKKVIKEQIQQNLRTIVKRKFLQVYRSDEPLENNKFPMIELLMENVNGQEIKNEDIEYCGQRYVELLAKISREKGNTKYQATRIGVKQLRKLIEERKDELGKNLVRLMADPNNRFGKKTQTIQIIFMLDALTRWAQMEGFTDKRLDTLIHIYEDDTNINKKTLITRLLEQFKSQLAKELQQTNLFSQSTKQGPIPELSFTLVYALIYCASLTQGYTLSIDDIVIGCGTLKMQYRNQTVYPEQRITQYKIRKTSSLLYRFLGYSQNSNLKTSIRKWVQKQCNICKIQHKQEVFIVANTLYQSELRKRRQRKQVLLYERYDILQQDIIAKAAVTIFIKMQLGFDGVPYLATFPKQLLDNKQVQQSQKQFLERVFQKRDSVVDLSNIIKNYEEYHHARHLKLQMYYPSSSYCSISGFSSKHLINYIKQCPYSAGNMKLNAKIASKNYKNHSQLQKYFVKTQLNQNDYPMSVNFMEQVKYAKRAQQRGRQFLNQLDLPSSNYQIFYEYMANIRHVDRKLFVFLAETITSECRLRDLFGWIQKLQRNMIDFQN